MPITLEELADLVRVTSDRTNRRIDKVWNETYGALMNIQIDPTDVRESLSVPKSVVEMSERIDAPEAEVDRLKQMG